MTEKVIGYLLLILGVASITFSLISVYMIFTKQMEPVKLFNFPSIELDLSQAAQINLPPELSEAGVSIDKSPSTKQEILPGNVLNDTSNIFAHLILMGFVVNVGFKIATLGTQLLRPIIVKVKPNKKPNSILEPGSNK